MNRIYEKGQSNEVKVYQIYLSSDLEFNLIMLYEVSDSSYYLVGYYLFHRNQQLTFNLAHSQYLYSILDGFAKGYLSKVHSDELFSVRSRKVDGIDISSLRCEFLENNIYIDHIIVSGMASIWQKVLHTSPYHFLAYHNDPILEAKKRRLSYEIMENREMVIKEIPGFLINNYKIHIVYTEKLTIVDFLDKDDDQEVEYEEY